ncbi:MAG: amidohydrolase [Thaumarchaeota archaeon]|nr:amidohydrolase [Nitrososphaerota archaeon]
MGLLIENCRSEDGTIGSVYIEEGKVVRFSEDTSQTVTNETQRIDGNSATLLPGLTDTHCHLFEYGWLKRNVDLRGTSNITSIRLRVSARVQRTPPGEWIAGMGWDQEALSERRMPTHADIDDLTPHNPVILTRVCGHIALLNSMAMKESRIEAMQGDEYDRDGAGALTGIVKETALPVVLSNLPRSEEACLRDLQSVEVEALKFGVTKVHCILSPEGFREELGALASLHSARSLSVRYRLFLPPQSLSYVGEKGLRERMNDEWLRIGGVKIYCDGSLGARTAALREPYADDPSNMGLLRHTDEELSDMVELADRDGYQVIIHAIGDRAVEQALGALTRVSGAKNERRHRIEHASLLPRDLRSEMAKHGIRAAIQPQFITSDTWAVGRLGAERARDLYPLRSMLREGILASGGSDSPIESLSPILGIWSAMVRGGYGPEEALDLGDAVRLYTANARSNGFDDGFAMAEGSKADFTLLDSDISAMHPAILRKVGVAATIVEGDLAYSGAAAASI